MPPLEAMQTGIPVASSNASCMPEILGDAAKYFDPHSPQSMRETIEALLRDGAQREECIAKGYERVKRYSWATLARITLSVYTEVGLTLHNGKQKQRSKLA